MLLENPSPPPKPRGFFAFELSSEGLNPPHCPQSGFSSNRCFRGTSAAGFMSVNQSRIEKTDGQLRKTARFGTSVQPRGYNGGNGARGRAGGAAPPSYISSSTSSDASPSVVAPALSTSRSLKKSGNGQGNQYRVNPENTSSEAGDASSSYTAHPVVQNGTQPHTVSSGFSDTSAPATLKIVDVPDPKGATRTIPKAPLPQSAAGASPSPSAPPKGDISSTFTLQFGTINAGMINGVQIPARTSSAPLNLDEQILTQTPPKTLETVTPMPVPSTPKQQQQQQTRKDINGSHQSSSGESHFPPQIKKDVSASIPPYAPVVPTPKSSLHPISGMPMPMPFQLQQRSVPPQFNGPNTQMQSPGLAANSQQMTMTLPVGNNSQVAKQIYVPGVQHHFVQQQAMVHQGQVLGFAPPIAHPLPPQLGNLGIGIGPQFPQQQSGKFGGARKTPVKITHPKTHEELRLDKNTDSVKDGLGAAHRSLPNVIAQPQSVPTYTTPHQMNFFSPMQPNSYSHSQLIYPNNIPLASAQIPTNSQAPRFNYPVSHSSMVGTIPSGGKPLPSTPVHGSHQVVKLEGSPVSASLPTSSQASVKPPVVSQNDKHSVSLSTSPVVISTPAAKTEAPKPLKVAADETALNQKQTETSPNGRSQQLKSGSEHLSIPDTGANSISAESVIPTQTACLEDSSTSETLAGDSGSVVARNDGKKKNESVQRTESFMDNQKRNKKDIRIPPKQYRLEASSPEGSKHSKADNRILSDLGAMEPVEGKAMPSASSSSASIWEKEVCQHASLSYAGSVGVASGDLSPQEHVPFAIMGSVAGETDTKTLDANLRVVNTDGDVRRENMFGVTGHESGAASDSAEDSSNVKVRPSSTVVKYSEVENTDTSLKQDGAENCGHVNSGEYDESDNKPLNGSNYGSSHKVQDNNLILNQQNRCKDVSLNASGSKTATVNDLHSAKDAKVKCEVKSSKDIGLTDSSVVDALPDPSPSYPVENKLESKANDFSSDGLVSAVSLGQKEKPSTEMLKPKITSGKKKNRKEILSKADAAGASDLYNAYKAPEIKIENISKSDGIRSPTAVTNITPADYPSKDAANEEDGQSKIDLDDWENAADISTPKLKISENGQHATEARKQHGDDSFEGTGRKKYSKDFLMTLSQHFTQLPVGFEIGSDIPESLLTIPVGKSPCPSPGRIIDRPSGSSRADWRMDDDKWVKSSVTFGRELSMDIGHGNSAAGLRPGQGSSHGVRVPHGQASNQFGGILSGPTQSQGSMPRNNSEIDRWQRGRGLIPSPLQVMHKAEKKYEVGKVSDEEEAKQRQLKSILNKLTPQNFEKLFAQVKEVNIDNAGTLDGVISQIFDKALMEPTFCEMYANFCFHLARELPDFSEDNKKMTFRTLLLNKCQEEFERGEREQAETNEIEEEGEVKESKEGREEKRLQARRRMLGNIRLIGELYKMRMLTERIMHDCIKKLLGQYQNPDEEDIEALCKLMSTIGEMIDHPKAKGHMDSYFDMMTELSISQKLSSRVRFMLRDAIDLRKNKWQQRRKVEGPKKIEEVHRDAAQERQAQSNRLARGPVITNVPRRGQAVDYGSRGSTPLASPSSQQTGGLRGLPTQVCGYGNQDVRLDNRHMFDARSISLPPSRCTDDSITLGPQGGLGKGMSIKGHPYVSSSNVSNEISPTVGGNRRMTFGTNDTNYTSDRFSGTTYDLPSPQDRNNYHVSKDCRILDRSLERCATSVLPAGRTHGNSGGSITAVSETRILPVDVLREKSISTIKEFYSIKDENEVVLCIKELNAPSFYPSMISLWVTDSFERKDMERDLLAKLIINLYKSRDSLFNQVQLLQGFELVLSSFEDAVNDAPRAAEFLGRIFAKVILENVAGLRDIGRLIHEGGEEPGRLLEIGLASEVLGNILETIRLERGDGLVNEIPTDLRLEDFRPPRSTKANKLDALI